MPTAINTALMKLRKRAEGTDPEVLVETFVDTGSLFAQLSSSNHQLIYGRRGTGKTHVLQYLAATARERDDVAIYVDLRIVGSSGGLYADTSISLAERGSRLLVDTLSYVHDQLTDYVLNATFQSNEDFGRACQALDQLAGAITDVRVVGTTETESKASTSASREASATLGLSAQIPNISAEIAAKRSAGESQEERTLERGVVRHRVSFGSVATHLTNLTNALPTKRMWLLLDEWSSLPQDLQPLLADMIKRCVLPVRGLTVKIAAIEQRSRFRVQVDGNDIGIELGADLSADVDLDDFMVFGNDPERARNFFRELFQKHVKAQLAADGDERGGPSTSDEFVRTTFTQHNAFDELVRAAEGVPRDAINVVAIAAQQAADNLIAVSHVRAAARSWYGRDKETAVEANPEALRLLHWIIDRVIRHRRARAFLLQQGEPSRHPLIGSLYDARVLHVLKRGISSRDHAGLRFNVYGLDYGCYVDLMATASAPQGLLPADTDDPAREAEFVEVPPDDYRAIRRAILELSEFEQEPTPAGDRPQTG